MKTTFDLPEALVRKLKVRAVREGRKMKDLAADILRNGLSSNSQPLVVDDPTVIKKHPKTGFPVIQGNRRATRRRQPTPEEISDLLIAQEADWIRESS